MTKEEVVVKSKYYLDEFSFEKIVNFHEFLIDFLQLKNCPDQCVNSYKDMTFNKVRDLVMKLIEKDFVFIISVFYPGDKFPSLTYVDDSLIEIFEFIQEGNWKKRPDNQWERNRASVSYQCIRISVLLSNGNIEKLANRLL